MSADRLHAGFGRTDITPSLAVPHAGWGAQTHLLADGVHRPLYVSVLLLIQDQDGRRTQTASVEFDLVGLYGLEEEIRAAVAREADIAAGAVRVSVTHNHANPVMWNNWIGGRPDEVRAYRSGLATAAGGAARAARLALRPVNVAADVGRCSIGRNRRQTIQVGKGAPKVIVGRDDQGATDPDVMVVRFDELDGSPYAALLGYTCHPTTLGPDNRLHSPDYPGVAKAVFEQATGAPALFFQGAAGNVGPRHGFVADIGVVERLGAELGLEAARTFVGLETRPVRLAFSHPRESGATLAIWNEEPVDSEALTLEVATERVALPLRPQETEAAASAAYRHWQQELARVTSDGSAPDVVESTMFQARRAQMAATRAATFGGRETIDLTLELLRIGDVAIVGCNGEPFCEIGLAVKAASPFRVTFFGGYTGPSLGYIPARAAYSEGGYEVDTTPYAEGAAERLVEAASDALRRLATN